MWLGSWAWDDVAGRLRQAGHDVHAVTLTGVGERAAEATPDVNLATHIDDIVDALADLRDVVLVGHSYGGLPVRGAADRVPERIARTVYVDSGPVPDGTAQIDTLGPEERAETERRVIDGFLIPPPSWELADDPVNNAGLDSTAVSLLHERATPHPLGCATQPLRLTKTEQPPTDLVCSTFPLDAVRKMIDSGDPFFAGLDRRHYRLHALPTGHWPMVSRPADLAEILSSVAG
jgi:pimeloyl-ACP methyl ester carboxylesterase